MLRATRSSPHGDRTPFVDVNWRMIRGAIDGDAMVLRKFRGIAAAARDAWESVSAADPRGTAPRSPRSGRSARTRSRRVHIRRGGAHSRPPVPAPGERGEAVRRGRGRDALRLLRDPDGRESLETLLSGRDCPSSHSGSPAARGSRSPGWRLKKTGRRVVGAGPAGMFVARTLAGRCLSSSSKRRGVRAGRAPMTDGKLNLSATSAWTSPSADDRGGGGRAHRGRRRCFRRTRADPRSTARTGSGSTRGSTGSPGFGTRQRRGMGHHPSAGAATHMGTDLATGWWPG